MERSNKFILSKVDYLRESSKFAYAKLRGIYDFLQKKKIENLNGLQLSTSPTASVSKKEEADVSENKRSEEHTSELQSR